VKENRRHVKNVSIEQTIQNIVNLTEERESDSRREFGNLSEIWDNKNSTTGQVTVSQFDSQCDRFLTK
jgi:hypothetical protein